MSATFLPRQQGIAIKCGRCGARLVTGQIQAGLIRTYAASIGWTRGLRERPWVKPGSYKLTANKRQDICPACTPAERSEAQQRKQTADERRAKRDAKLKARDAQMRQAK